MQGKNKKRRISKIVLMKFSLVISFILVFLTISCASIDSSLKLNEETNSKTSISQGSQTSSSIQENQASQDTKNNSYSQDTNEGVENSSYNNKNSGKVVFLEITSDPKSNHFEHRVANIYSKDVISGNKELIFSDINEKFEIGQVFSISPDGNKILCDMVEGGRGAYSAICFIDIPKKTLKVLDEFDFTKNEGANITSAYYGKPIWSSDSKFIAYEVISNPFSNNIRDGGIFKINIETGEKKEIELNVEGASIRSTLFLSPIFFFENNKKIACVFHTYNEINKSSESPILSTRNEEVVYITEETGEVNFLFDLAAFKNEGPEIISSFDNFKYIEKKESFIFHVLGDFEEDGDIWIANIRDSSVKKLTNDNNLREQQPDFYIDSDGQIKITYVGVKRYGTISNQIPSGDIYLSDLSGNNIEKLTSYEVGTFKPITSPDGKSIAYMHAIYDDNFENILQTDIETINISTKKITKIAQNSYSILVGWIK